MIYPVTSEHHCYTTQTRSFGNPSALTGSIRPVFRSVDFSAPPPPDEPVNGFGAFEFGAFAMRASNEGHIYHGLPALALSLERIINSNAAPGMLANYAFEPALLADGNLASSVGAWFGVGKGRGTGFLFFVVGALAVIVAVLALLDRRLYRLEAEVEDAL